MRFHFGTLPIDVTHFRASECPLGIDDYPFPNILVGRENRNDAYGRLWIGNRLFKKLKKVELPCPLDGKTAIGKCKECGLEVTKEMIKEVNKKPFVEHREIKKVTSIAYGSLMVTRQKGTVLIIEEKASDKDRIGILFQAEGGKKGGASVEVILKDPDSERNEIHQKLNGEIWANPRKKDVGFTAERFMILKPGDRLKVTRTGDYEDHHPGIVIVGVMPDFTMKAMSVTDWRLAEEESQAAQDDDVSDSQETLEPEGAEAQSAEKGVVVTEEEGEPNGYPT